MSRGDRQARLKALERKWAWQDRHNGVTRYKRPPAAGKRQPNPRDDAIYVGLLLIGTIILTALN